MKLPFIAQAGVTIPGPNGAPYVVPTASLEDWNECLERARAALSNGFKRVSPGMTWETALATLAARYLRSGSASPDDPAMGRPEPWPAGEEQRWIDAVVEAGERPSLHVDPVTGAGTGTVATAEGRVPLSTVARWSRDDDGALEVAEAHGAGDDRSA